MIPHAGPKHEKRTTTAAYCNLATTLDQQDGPPTPKQLRDTQRLAPDEIRDPVDAAAARLIAAGEDPVAQGNAFGDDEEALTLDLEPGRYDMVCFIAGPDGQPHAFQGMQYEFTVT